MKVSVITSAFNCQDYILPMINSIISQTYTDWEMIIIDDASTDHTWNILEQINDNRIIKIKSPKNRGLTKNLNIAMRMASGKYILRMDADDIALPQRIEKQVYYMEEHPEVILSGCWMQCFDKQYDVMRMICCDDEMRIRMLFNSVIFHPTFIMRSKKIKEYNINYNEKLEFAQDYDIIFQLYKYGRIANIPEVLLKYRVHNAQISIEKREKQMECANETRKAILHAMGIELTDEEFNYWTGFCIDSMKHASEIEKKCIQNIIEIIQRKNQELHIYNENMLRDILNHELERCLKTVDEEWIKHTAQKWEDKYFQTSLLMNRWVRLKQEGKSLADFIIRKNYKEIAIYGMGNIGETLLYELYSSNIKVKYAIDKNKNFISSEIKVVSPDQELEYVDVLIVTAIYFYKEIKEEMSMKIKCPIISLEEVMYEWGE